MAISGGASNGSSQAANPPQNLHSLQFLGLLPLAFFFPEPFGLSSKVPGNELLGQNESRPLIKSPREALKWVFREGELRFIGRHPISLF